MGRSSSIVSNFLAAITWSRLKVIGGSPVAKATILLPFFGYLIVYNDAAVTILMSAYDGKLSEFLGISSEAGVVGALSRIFLGLVSMGIGSLAYRFFCPNEIDKYDDYLQYLQSELEAASEFRGRFLHELVGRRITAEERANHDLLSIPTAEEAVKDMQQIASPGKAANWTTWFDKCKGKYSALVEINYEQLDRTFFPVRVFTATAYLIGFSLLVWPSLKVLLVALKTLQ